MTGGHWGCGGGPDGTPSASAGSDGGDRAREGLHAEVSENPVQGPGGGACQTHWCSEETYRLQVTVGTWDLILEVMRSHGMDGWRDESSGPRTDWPSRAGFGGEKGSVVPCRAVGCTHPDRHPSPESLAKQLPWQTDPGAGLSCLTSGTGSVECCFRIPITSGSPMAPRASPKSQAESSGHSAGGDRPWDPQRTLGMCSKQ